MNTADILSQFQTAYYSPARCDEHQWQNTQEGLTTQADSIREKELVALLNQSLSDFAISPEEQDQLRKKFFLSTTLRPKLWQGLLTSTPATWTDWAIGYFNAKTRSTHRLDAEDTALVRTLFSIPSVQLSADALALLTTTLYSTESDLVQSAWNHLASLGPVAHEYAKDLVLASLLVDEQIVVPKRDVFGITAQEETDILIDFLETVTQANLQENSSLIKRLGTTGEAPSQQV
ncbi:MAG TPA: hypothetical protein VJC18_01400, partial [bacterium]|nr:hypothetical protein [bacterium]